MLSLVAGRVPLVIELKGIPGHDARAGGEGRARNCRNYAGKAAIMSFDHWLIRDFPKDAPGIAAGLTAYGGMQQEFEAHFSMLVNGISFVSYDVTALPNRFVAFRARAARHAGDHHGRCATRRRCKLQPRACRPDDVRGF